MRNIYCARFKVRLTSRHPQFFKVANAIIAIFLIDDEPESFLQRAEQIVRQLPCEIIQETGVRVISEAVDNDIYNDSVAAVGMSGFGFHEVDIARDAMTEEKFLALPMG